MSEPKPVARPADRVFSVAESVVYTATGVLLVGGAVIALVTVTYHLVVDIGKGSLPAIQTALDGLLLVFILLELLAGVRATMIERELIAEPFLLAGIIASIKEIVVITLETKSTRGLNDQVFRAAMTEVGALAVVILLLALSTLFIRRKEREPEE